MAFIIAIHPDDYTAAGKPPGSDASSGRWSQHLEERGHKVKWVDVRRADSLEQVKGCHGFMWRWAHFGGMGRIARRLLPVIENELKIPVYPDQHTCWHYDDKIAQAYLFKALDIATPATWIWFDRSQAETWASQAKYPLVLKLAIGAGSFNVRLVRDAQEARLWIERLFSHRIENLAEDQFAKLSLYRRLRRSAGIMLKGRPPSFGDSGFEFNTGYVLFQEFLAGNIYDTRVTVIGNRAFAYRRFNRPADFRASGSGLVDYDPAKIDEGFIRLAFSAAKKLRAQSCAIDGLYRGKECVLGEVSYTYISAYVNSCPGHWDLDGDPQTGQLTWVSGSMWPEEAQVADFIAKVRRECTGDGTPGQLQSSTSLPPKCE